MAPKKKQKADREQAILIGLVELFLLTGKPVGSNTLKENGCEAISSATIRNHFANLEKKGFLKQEHSSAGRVPTPAAFKLYASHHMYSDHTDPQEFDFLKKELQKDTREIAGYLQSAAELLSTLTQGAVFFSSPRFDQDFIINIKVVGIDAKRCLAVVVTDFRLIYTEILHTPKKLSSFSIKRLETYFTFRLTGLDRPKLNKEEEALGTSFYNELMMRYIVGHSNFSAEDIYKTGFSKLIGFPEFRDATVLATNLSIFEDTAFMRTLLGECTKDATLKAWIGDDLNHPSAKTAQSSIIAVPYFIRGKAIGAIALLGPIRMPYPKIFGTLKSFSSVLSEVLTRNLCKYKITYRQPAAEQVELKTEPPKLIE
ncbi:MAG: heat-inducible transcriptional repressor HrcA [Simkaniaceae bacterium]|nr:heat-inducible transcriptional repressor HrcA [Simkaniaceae bacterium]